MKTIHINWIRFTSVLCSRIIRDAILPLNDKGRVNVLIIDDSMFERNRSKKVELLAKVYDHAKHVYPVWISHADPWMVRWKYISADKQHSFDFWETEKSRQ